jgi:hypothetical protein
MSTSSPFGALANEERVPQRAQEVAEVVFAAQEAWFREHARIRLLDEILGVLARAAERPRRTVEPVDVVARVLEIERSPVPGRHRADF